MFRFDVIDGMGDRMIDRRFVKVLMRAALGGSLLIAACRSPAPAPQPAHAPHPSTPPSTAPRTNAPTMPGSSTRQDVDLYKAGIKQGCVNQCIQRGDAAASIDAFCGCISETFNRSLSPAQWQAASDAARAMNSAEEAKVFAPYMAQAKSCKKPK
jgi:hypothetical protein